MSSSVTAPITKPRRTSKRTRPNRVESREILLHHEAPHTDVSLVRVGTGGVDRKTGAPLHTYWEMTAKLRGHALTTRTFSHESNARIAYLMAQHGETDFSAALKDLGPRLWPEPKNLTALATLPRREGPMSPVWAHPGPPCTGESCWCHGGEDDPASGTRMNTGDSEAESSNGGGAAPWTRPDRPELFREVPVEEIEAEESAVLAAAI
jgi:hypothetical protein